MTHRTPRTLLAAAAVSLAAGAALAPSALARHGADDPAGHDARDDHGGRVAAIARDDRGRHHRHRHGGHGRDDGPNHR
jgi:hypothetical protein